MRLEIPFFQPARRGATAGVWRGLALTLAGTVAVASAWALEPDVIFERISPSIWRVATFDADGRPLSQGSAVVTNPQQVVTNCHVLAKARRVSISKQGVVHPASLELYDPERDLCQLKVPSLDAPAVTRATESQLRVGAKAYAIGNPRGLELTLSDGLISSLRRDKDGKLQRVQTTAPISPGSSGGGLFDSEGRLIGLTTAQVVDGQNLNFAIPADWITELPARHANLVAKREQARAAQQAAAAGPLGPVKPGEFRVGDTFEYSITDRSVGRTQKVSLRVDSNDGQTIRINSGAVVLDPDGKVFGLTTPTLSELDLSSPPGGWVSAAAPDGMPKSLKYVTRLSGLISEFALTASLVGDETIKVSDREFKVRKISLSGRMIRNPVGTGMNASGPYQATLWFSDELKRPVKYEVSSRSIGSFGAYGFLVNESVVLEGLRRQ